MVTCEIKHWNNFKISSKYFYFSCNHALISDFEDQSFPQLHWYWQPKSRKQNTIYPKHKIQTKSPALANKTIYTLVWYTFYNLRPGNWLEPILTTQRSSSHISSWCLWASTSTACIPMSNIVRYGICRHNYAVERGLVVGFCGQPLYCNPPYYLTAGFQSPSSHMVSAQPFPDRPTPMQICIMGSCPITFLWLWLATDHEPHSWHVPTNKIRRRTETTPQSRWWHSHMFRINSEHSTREMKWKSSASQHNVSTVFIVLSLWESILFTWWMQNDAKWPLSLAQNQPTWAVSPLTGHCHL